jgi:hypothetical protein
MSQVLSPNDLRLAAEAYRKALSSLPAEAYELQPYAARRMVAIHVIDAALDGVRDPDRLRDRALEYVRSVIAKGTTRPVKPFNPDRLPQSAPTRQRRGMREKAPE